MTIFASNASRVVPPPARCVPRQAWRDGSTLFGERTLALQLHFLFKMRGACSGLMGPSPERPGDDVSGLDVLLVQPHGHAADLLHRPADQGHGPIGAGLAPAWVGRMARSLAARQSLSRHSGDGGLPPAWQRPA